MSKPLRVGLVGTGKFAGHHAGVWRSVPGVQLTGVHGSEPGRLQAFAESEGVMPFPRYEELLRACDLLDIVSANDTHAGYALRAIPRVRGLIVEKPLAADVSRAEMVQRMAAERGLTASVVSQYRFQRGTVGLRRLLDAQRLGPVLRVRARLNWPRDDAYFAASGGWRGDRARSGGGVLIHQGIHLIDLLLWWFGPVEAVSGSTEPEARATGAVERTFVGTVEFASGVVCDLALSTKPSRETGLSLEVEGRDGTAVTDGETVWRGGGRPSNWLARAARRLRRRTNASALLRRQFLDVLRAMRDGTSPSVTLTDGLNALRTVDALYRSAAEGRRVALRAAEAVMVAG